MRSVQSKSIKYFLIGLCATLSACGGGGGGSAPPPTPLTDDQLLGIAKSANTADWILLTADNLLGKAPSLLTSSRATLSGSNTTALNGDTPYCTSGSYTVTWNFNDTLYYSVGDNVTVDFKNCVRPNTLTYKGTVTFSITAASLNGTTDVVTITSNLNNFSIQIAQSSTLSFSNADNLTYTRTRLALGNNSYTYPVTFSTNGAFTATLGIVSNNLAAGTYTISNVSVLKNYPTDENNLTREESFTSSDGTYNGIVNTNVIPRAFTLTNNAYTTTTYPTNKVAYSGATINLKTNSSSSTTMSGTNTDGSTFTTVDTGYGYSY